MHFDTSNCQVIPKRFVDIQLVKILLEVIFVNAIVDFLIRRKTATAWTLTNVSLEWPFVLVSLNARILLVPMTVLVLPDTNYKPTKLMTRKGISIFRQRKSSFRLNLNTDLVLLW